MVWSVNIKFVGVKIWKTAQLHHIKPELKHVILSHFDFRCRDLGLNLWVELNV